MLSFYALFLGGRPFNRRRGARPRIKSGASSYVDKVSYTYDALGQLTRENNVDLNQTIVYTYDNGGNIKSKKIYAYTTGTVGALQNTINYTYDSTWKDKLTNYNGTAITYDAIGNPLTYRNGMSFTWNGRQMATANLNGTAVTYKYDADGLRTTKQVGSTLYEYEYVGGQLVYEKRGDLKFYYRYNTMGELASIKRINAAGSEYTVYVVTNTRGDVEELRLADGSLYARYVYDSWGNVLHVYNSSGVEETNVNALSLQNPFRYRSYYYDAESGLYYLQSRYYDPVTCRFVNADTLVNTTDVLGFNMYAYCANNPVIRKDTGGNLFDVIFDVVSIAYSAYEVIKNPRSVTNWLALAADVASAVLPGITGGGAAVKAVAKYGDDVLDLAKAGDKVHDTYKAADRVGDTYSSSRAISNFSGGACFIAGTTILGAWSKKNIEDISPGDYVFATDPETGETRLKRVVQTFVNETDELVYVYVNGEEIVTTPEHPFYVSNNGWVGAINLRAGDKLVLVNGEFAVIEKVQHEILEQPINVYNFEVEDFHTYYVSNTSVLVHNMCYNISKGSTATRQPSNLTEQLVLEQVKSNPQGSPLKNFTMQDPRWPASEGWQKMSQIVNTSKGNYEVHYLQNNILNLFDDFKLK